MNDQPRCVSIALTENTTDQTTEIAFHQANDLAQRGRHADALKALEKVIELAPDNAIAHHARGFELIQLGRPNEALTALDRALEIEPYLIMTGFLRVAVLASLGRREEAISAFEDCPPDPTPDSNVYVTRAAAQAQLGWLDDALDSLEDAFEGDFDSWTILAGDPSFKAMREDTEYGPRLTELVDYYRQNGLEVPPQDRSREFTVTGSEESPERVEARLVEEALGAGRPIRLEHTRVVGPIKFAGVFDAAFLCSNTRFDTLNLSGSTFAQGIFFGEVTCSGDISFESVVFADSVFFAKTHFNERVDFSNTRFAKRVHFSEVYFGQEADFSNTEFRRDASFTDSTFDGSVSFRNAGFSGVRFHKVRFSSNVGFDGAAFRRHAEFVHSVWPAAISFKEASFGRKADFGWAQFEDVADFRSATFARGADFQGTRFKEPGNFMYAVFGEEVDRLRDPAAKAEANFSDVTFTKSAVFVKSRFHCKTQFNRARFVGEADYVLSFFGQDALFPAAVFREKANFQHAHFGGSAGFPVVDFHDEVDFATVTFGGPVIFTGCSLRDKSRLTGCLYEDESEIDCAGVTGFTQMLAEWWYNPSYDQEGPVPKGARQRRGLKGRLRFDEVFYIALVKNYREMGWLRECDDAQFTYRRERRKRAGALRRVTEFLFLELTFGYGTRPFRLLANFILAGLVFAGVYTAFLSHTATGASLLNSTYFSVDWLTGIGWGLLHSLDVMTPGINLNSLGDPLLVEQYLPLRIGSAVGARCAMGTTVPRLVLSGVVPDTFQSSLDEVTIRATFTV